MFYKALITRMYSMADESLQIIVEDTDTFETFKDRVYTALRVTDYRANVQMKRLFEDTDLTNQLDYEELKACRTAADTMYPVEHFSRELELGSKAAFEFAKNLPSGEVLKVFLHDVNTEENLSLAISHVWDIIDSRLQKTNKRELDFMAYIKSLPFSIKLKVSKIMDILYGRVLKDTVVEQLKGAKSDVSSS